MNAHRIFFFWVAKGKVLTQGEWSGMKPLRPLIGCVAGVVLFGASALGQTVYEAEDATLSGPSVASQWAGFSGTGYADYNNASGDFVEFELNASSAGSYPIAFRYGNGGTGDRPLELRVNGAVVTSGLSFAPTGGWTTWGFTATNNVSFKEGLNTVRLTATGSSGGNVDYLLVAVNGTAPATNNAAGGTNVAGAPLRRPVSPQQPMWIIHIDTWNYADPQKIIDLIPADIRPYVVMDLSLSISHTATNSQFQVAEYGYEIAKSWMRVCAQNQMWAMIQQSSGGFHHFSEFDLSVYEEFFRNYPNFIGFNYAEQFWGFDDPSDPLSARWTDRIAHFADLLPLCNKYGGYLVVSWCGNQWSPSINPIGMLKRNPTFAAACRTYTENFILCEKYTQTSYISDMESLCLGAYLSGYSGQYGIRYDSTGWTDATGTNQNFILATGGAAHLEHIMLTGETVIDGPELIWQQCFRELSTASTSNSYTMRRWDTFPQFGNVMVDLFRKILDGTVRIPSRQEVIDRTKVVVVNDVTSGGNDSIYSSPDSLSEGLYRMDGDGNLKDNKTFFKKTGRYPTVPTVFKLDDAAAQSFRVKVNKSAYSTRWPSIAAKTNELNNLFPQEYTGDLYAGRHENGWVVYDPFKTGQAASGSIPFKYNSCDHVDLTFSQYTSGVMKEYADRVTFYLANYDNALNTGLKTDTIRIYGSTAEPTYSYADRGSHQASVLTKSWSGGVFTLTVQHNGPLDINVNCAGAASGRLTSFTTAVVTPPAPPMPYAGPLQFEAECFDFKSIGSRVTSGWDKPVRNYTGQGYVQFGTSSSAGLRDSVKVLKAGTFRLETKYSVTGANVSTIDLYVNGVKVATPLFSQTPALSSWATNKQYVSLNAGNNTIEFKANGGAVGSVYFDNIVVAPTAYGDGLVIQENESGFGGVDGTIDNNYAGYTGDGFANTADTNGASVYWNFYFDSSVVKAFTFRYACTSAGTADLIINGTNVASKIQFPVTGSLSTWDYVTVYADVSPGVANVRLKSTSNSGLPNMDSLEVTGIGTIPQPQLSLVPSSGGQMVLRVNGASGLEVQIQSSADLAGWNTIFTTNSPAMPFSWTNSISGSAMEFFRAVVGPSF